MAGFQTPSSGKKVENADQCFLLSHTYQHVCSAPNIPLNFHASVDLRFRIQDLFAYVWKASHWIPLSCSVMLLELSLSVFFWWSGNWTRKQRLSFSHSNPFAWFIWGLHLALLDQWIVVCSSRSTSIIQGWNKHTYWHIYFFWLLKLPIGQKGNILACSCTLNRALESK